MGCTLDWALQNWRVSTSNQILWSKHWISALLSYSYIVSFAWAIIKCEIRRTEMSEIFTQRHTYTCLWTIPSRSFQTKSPQSILKIHKMQIPFITWNASGKKTKEEKQLEVRIFKVWNVPKLEKCLNLQWWKCTKWNTSVLKQLMFLGQIKFPSSILMQNYVLWNGKWLKIYQIKSKHWKAFLMARSN